ESRARRALLHAPRERGEDAHLDRTDTGHPLHLAPLHADARPRCAHAAHHASGAAGRRSGGALTAKTRSRARAALFAVVGVVTLAACRQPTLPVLGDVPAFSLTERAGTPFTQDDVRGAVWIADFIFTRCPDVCPILTTRMRDLQRTLDGSDP